MALKILMLRHKLDQLRAAFTELENKDAEFVTRENELAADIDAASTDEEQAAVEAAVEKFDADKTAHETEKARLNTEISELETQIAADEAAQTPPADEARTKHKTERTIIDMPYNVRFSEMSHDQCNTLVEREDVKNFLTHTRELGTQNRSITGVDLLIPDVLLGLIRTEVASSSKLLSYVNVVNVPGSARQNIMGTIPEAIWTEMCAKINELEFGFNQVEVDGYKVGGYVAICNAVIADSDIALVSEIISVISTAIAKAIDKAILFGTGIKMPVGIATRLAQTTQPESWGTRAPAWTDLHTANVLTTNVSTASGVEFFSALIAQLAVAKPKYSSDGLFWAMNRKTHLDILTKALNFNSAGALVAGANTFPIIGGEIIEFEDDELADYEIIGGFGKNYLLAQRQGATFAQSEHVRFLDDQTVFKGTARYDGMPVAGEAFVIVNYANTSPTTEKDFAVDYANADMNLLTVTAAAGTANGDTVLTVTNTVANSDAVLKYKLRTSTAKINAGDTPRGTWTALTSGTTQITASAGVNIAVVELDSAGRIISTGEVASVPKA